MNTFTNTVTLRGYFGETPKVPALDKITRHSVAILSLATTSSIWDFEANQWRPAHIDWHRVICPGAYFCGLLHGMKPGEYLEVQGELRDFVQEYTFVAEGMEHSGSNLFYAVHAIRIIRLDRPDALVDYGEDD